MTDCARRALATVTTDSVDPLLASRSRRVAAISTRCATIAAQAWRRNRSDSRATLVTHHCRRRLRRSNCARQTRATAPIGRVRHSAPTAAVGAAKAVTVAIEPMIVSATIARRRGVATTMSSCESAIGGWSAIATIADKMTIAMTEIVTAPATTTDGGATMMTEIVEMSGETSEIEIEIMHLEEPTLTIASAFRRLPVHDKHRQLLTATDSRTNAIARMIATISDVTATRQMRALPTANAIPARRSDRMTSLTIVTATSTATTIGDRGRPYERLPANATATWEARLACVLKSACAWRHLGAWMRDSRCRRFGHPREEKLADSRTFICRMHCVSASLVSAAFACI